MTQNAHGGRMEPPPFRVGDCVYVITGHIHTNRATRQLAEKKFGPFPIISQPSATSTSFTLHLPSIICIHIVFHVAQLEPENPNTFEDHDQPPPPLVVDGNPEYLIELIVDSKYNRVRSSRQLLYHIKWVSYPISNNPSRTLIMSSIPQSPDPNTWPRNGSNVRAPRLHTSRHHRRYNTTTPTTHYYHPSSTPSPDRIHTSLR